MIKAIRKHPKITVYVFGLVVAIIITAFETFRLRYSNYLVYSDSTMDFWNGINPYTQHFVETHGRYFLYTPVVLAHRRAAQMAGPVCMESG